MFSLTLFLLSVLLIYLYLKRRNDYWKSYNIVQVNCIIKKIFIEKHSLGEVIADAYKSYPQEKYIGFYLNRPAVILKEIEDIQNVLQKDFQNFHSRGIISNPNDTLAQNVLFIDNYYQWRLLRQKMSPIFTTKKLKKMFYIINRCARDFIEIDENLVFLKKNSFEAISALTTASIAATTFGIDTTTKNTIDSPFLHMVKKSIEPTLEFNVKFGISTLSPYLFKLLNLKFFSKHEKFFIGTFKNVLQIRRENSDFRYDFIDTCIELQKSGIMQDSTTGYQMAPTNEVLAAQAFFFFLAGADTTAITMHFTLLELASNPDILLKVHKEIDEKFAKYEETLTYEAVENMSYLDMVLNESMRKYPPISFVERLCINSTILPAGNFKIEKGTAAVIPIFALHRDKRYFPNPDVFDPERFAPENIETIKTFCYLPFGGGNRICLGLRLARLQIKTGIAWLLRKYTLKEQNYRPKKFDNSNFGLRDTKAHFELIPRSK